MFFDIKKELSRLRFEDISLRKMSEKLRVLTDPLVALLYEGARKDAWCLKPGEPPGLYAASEIVQRRR
jgi:hypothetical protein